MEETQTNDHIQEKTNTKKSSSLLEVLFKYMKKPGWKQLWLDNVWSM
jgi:hypothetical protein